MTVANGLTFETVIGLEVHAQLLTRSKMYCGCSAEYANAEPNTHTCPICLGLPGALPVINSRAIELCISTGLALNCEIPAYSKLDRKNYVYPDLPKGYQISQYDLPLCSGGQLEFYSGGRSVTAGITRVHIEEDTGRLVHRSSKTGAEISLVDLNRSGVPLMEIVGDPDLRSPEEARDYLIALRQLLRTIGASTGNMEEGAFRCDANVSVRTADRSVVGAKVEIKNMNSFRAVERALRFEVIRQSELFAAGGHTVQETRGWSEAKAETVSQRTKEQAHDYRYFPEPDLPPLEVTTEAVARLRDRLPELPAARRSRFVTAYGLKSSDAAILTSDEAIAAFFEATLSTVDRADRPKMAANWVANDVLGLQHERGLTPEQLPIEPGQLRGLLDAIDAGVLTQRAAKAVLVVIGPGEDPIDVATRLDLIVLEDEDALNVAVSATLADFPDAVADFRNGKRAAIGRLIGETIKRTGGRANPDTVRRLLEQELNAG